MTDISDPPDQPTQRREPIATWLLIGLLVAVFLVQMGTSKSIQSGLNHVSVTDLIAAGAMSPPLLSVHDQWWRLFTAPLLHGGMLHLGLNCLALYFAGRFLESHLGGAFLWGLWAVGAVAGAFTSFALGDNSLVSVGASGGIMATLAGALALCFALPEDADTVDGKSLFTRILVPSLIPSSSGVDYAAHGGGAVAGVAIAATLYAASWLTADNKQIFRAGVGASVLYACGVLYGLLRIVGAL